VLTIEQAISHPHLRERGTVQRIKDPFLGEFDIPGFPLRFSEFPGRLELVAPTLGQHNEEILRDYLGMAPEKIEHLTRDGILHRGPR
jgi:CoA:oxalate CoA-transferase